MGVKTAGAEGSAITTIAVAGFPLDASQRELKNLCRLFPGFQKAAPRLIPGRPTVLFAKFDSQESASDVIIQLQEFVFDEEFSPDQKLKAEFARGEMREDIGQHNSCQQSWPASHTPGAGAPWQLAPSSYAPPQKRPRTAVTIRPIAPVFASPAQPWTPPPMQSRKLGTTIGQVDGVDTLACKVLPTQTGNGIRDFFQQHAGFVVLKDNNSKNCFVKFESHFTAASAMAAAQEAGFLVELARSSMQLKPGEGDGQPEQWNEFPHPDAAAWTEAPWRPQQPAQWHQGSAAGSDASWTAESDTIACKAGTFTEQEFQDFFGCLPGYVKMKFNVKNCFLKFESAELAQEAINTAIDAGHTAEFARFSLP